MDGHIINLSKYKKNGGFMGKKVRVAIIGIGNCASSFIQGIQYYSKLKSKSGDLNGLIHQEVGGYRVEDIEVVAAFDIAESKVGKDLSEAIFSSPNNTIKFAEVPQSGIIVQRGMTHDGIGKYVKDKVIKAEGETVDVEEILKTEKCDVVISYLPVGSEEATKWYVEQLLKAKCGFVNCVPVFIAREKYWRKRFEKAGVPIIGDDIKSQVGATITHRILTQLLKDRGVSLRNTYQLNFGGNTDFLNMLERERLTSKKISKTQSVVSQIGNTIGSDNVHIGPSDYVPWLNDRKWAYIRIEGEGFGGTPLNMELKLEVWDSPNSAGVVTDAVRCCKVAIDRGLKGAILGPAAYFMKSPPIQYSDYEAKIMVDEFVLEQSS